MNITNLLRLLTEERGIEYINNTLQSKVPPQALNALSSKMKKGKYDNEAMAILKVLQINKEDPKTAYLAAHAGLVYSLLKRLKRGNSSFNSEEILNNYYSSNENAAEFWKNIYLESKKETPALSKKEKDYNTTGLKTARVKELSDSFVILPKNFTKHELVTTLDIKKSQEDIRKISAEIAAKDTSGETVMGRKSTDNHWCVATGPAGEGGVWNRGGEHYFKQYKNWFGSENSIGKGAGIFVIAVEKNKDGSPNWNKRYLMFGSGEVNKEFADKFDRHVGTDDIPHAAMEFFNKVIKDFRNKNRLKTIEIEKEVRDRKSAIVNGDYKTVERPKEELNKVKEIMDVISECEKKGKIYKAAEIQKTLANVLKGKAYTNVYDDREIETFLSLKPVSRLRIYTSKKDRENRNNYLGWINNNGDKYDFVWGGLVLFERMDSVIEIYKELDKCVDNKKYVEKVVSDAIDRTRENRAKNEIYKEKLTNELSDETKKQVFNNKEFIKAFNAFDKNPSDIRGGGFYLYYKIPSPYSSKEKRSIYLGIYPKTGKVEITKQSERNHYYRSGRVVYFEGNLKDNDIVEKLKKVMWEMYDAGTPFHG